MAFNLLKLTAPRLLLPHSFSTIPYACDLIQPKSTNVNVWDSFTSDLLSRVRKKHQFNREECGNIARSKGIPNSLMVKITSHQKVKQLAPEDARTHSCDIRTLSRAEFDQYMNLSINSDDRPTFTCIVEQIIEHKLLPSDEVILRAMGYLCEDRNGCLQKFTRLIDVCVEKNIAFYATNPAFLPYLAQYYWEANQLEDALRTLRQINATHDLAIRSSVENNFRKILSNSITHREETAIEKMEKFATEISRQYGESALLIHVWWKCFVSEWFVDQERARRLFKSSKEVRTAFAKGTATFVFEMLQSHQDDAVYRLIELCLTHDMKDNCFVCLSLLFDYQCEH